MKKHARRVVFSIPAILVIACGLALIPTLRAAENPESKESVMTVTAGRSVSLEYTLKNDEGTVLDSNVDGDPLTYIHGRQEILPKLEEALEGMKTGDSRQVTLAPADGYGEVDKEAIVEIPVDRIPEDARKVGMRLQGKSPDGRVVTPLVVEIKESTCLLDFNHPLAGVTLKFEVKVLDIAAGEAASAAGN